jgi:UrcA family protein
MTKLLLTAAAVLALAGAAHAAPVAADNDVPTQQVSTRGVNFADAAQARHFYAKLQGAAQAVCGSTPSSQDLTCVRRNMNDAVSKVAAPQLTAMLNNTYGAPKGSSGTAFAADAR